MRRGAETSLRMFTLNRSAMKQRNEEEKENIGYRGYRYPPSNFFDTYWPRLREVMAFVGGFGIMMYEAVGDQSDRPWLYAAAIGMMGLPLARYAETTLGRLGGGGPSDEPPPMRRKQSRYENGEG